MPPETDLPAVVPTGSPVRADPADGADGASGSGRERGRRRRGGGDLPLRLLGLGAAVLLAVLVALGLATLLGEGFREAVLIEVEDGPVGSEPTYSDAPREAARFFADRDSVAVSVPRDMTVADFLALYHLENNPGARAALRDQLGAAASGDLLREGDRVTVPLTLRRDEPGAGADAPTGAGSGPIGRDLPSEGDASSGAGGPAPGAPGGTP